MMKHSLPEACPVCLHTCTHLVAHSCIFFRLYLPKELGQDLTKITRFLLVTGLILLARLEKGRGKANNKVHVIVLMRNPPLIRKARCWKPVSDACLQSPSLYQPPVNCLIWWFSTLFFHLTVWGGQYLKTPASTPPPLTSFTL